MSLPINNYCERLSSDFWAEPVNALSNAAFLLSSIAVWYLLRKRHLKGYYLILPYQLGIVAVGSFLWHTSRSQLTHILDGGLLYIFIASLLLFLIKLLTNKWNIAWIGLSVIVLLQIAVFMFLPHLRDTPVRHIIALLTFGVITAWITSRVGKIPKSIVIALFFYVAAIFAKGIDLSVCQAFPTGTHFLWHVFGAVAGYFSVVALLELDINITQKKKYETRSTN